MTPPLIELARQSDIPACVRMIPTLRAQGFALLLAGITIPNDPSVRLHEGFGFVRCATYHRVGWKFPRWHDVGRGEDYVPTPSAW